MPPLLIDTGVVSRFILRKPAFVRALSEANRERELFITFATRLELYEWIRLNRSVFGERRYREALQAVEAFPKLPHTAAATNQALALGRHVPHVGVADYIKAASALVKKCPLFTLNRKHFKRTNVKLYESPDSDFAKESQ